MGRLIGHQIGSQLLVPLLFLGLLLVFAPMSGFDSLGAPVVLRAKPKPTPKSRSQRPSILLPGSFSAASVLPVDHGPSPRMRSRSPVREALPGFRHDAPGRLERRVVGLPKVLSEAQEA